MTKRLLVLWGPPAVGKMTVGQELEARTGLKLFHNHMTIEPLLPFFDFHDPAFQRLKTLFRLSLCEEVAASDLPGMVFTYAWALDNPKEKTFIDGLTELFRNHGADIFYAELYASLETRLQRNGTENRLKHKASKRDVPASNARMQGFHKRYVLNSSDAHPFFYKEYSVRINIESLPADATAEAIISAFGW